MISWILDALPWWWYLVPVTVGILIALPYLLPVWAALPSWARWLLGGFAGALVAFLAGRNKGRQNELERQRQRDAQAEAARRKSDAAVDKMDDSAKRKELDKWLRD